MLFHEWWWNLVSCLFQFTRGNPLPPCIILTTMRELFLFQTQSLHPYIIKVFTSVFNIKVLCKIRPLSLIAVFIFTSEPPLSLHNFDYNARNWGRYWMCKCKGSPENLLIKFRWGFFIFDNYKMWVLLYPRIGPIHHLSQVIRN